jgi:hypothetical protein
MKLFGLFLISFSILLLAGCGGDKSIDAEQAFLKGDYTKAIEGYQQVYKQDSTSQRIKERLALAYMYRGQELYKKINNLSSFVRNFEEGQKYIPSEPSSEFNRVYSQIVFQVGQAYYKAHPDNEVEKDIFLSKTTSLMHQALELDSTNVDAQNILDEIKLNNYQKTIDYARSIYDRAQGSGNNNLYFDALTQIRKAQAMGGTNSEMRRMLSRIYAKTLAILNFEDGLALAVLSQEYSNGKIIFGLVIRNYLSYPLTLSFDNFVLADYRGTLYSVDQEIMARDYNMSGVKQISLSSYYSDRQHSDMDGYLVFALPDSVNLDYIGYRIGAGRISKKYFPF